MVNPLVSDEYRAAFEAEFHTQIWQAAYTFNLMLTAVHETDFNTPLGRIETLETRMALRNRHSFEAARQFYADHPEQLTRHDLFAYYFGTTDGGLYQW